MRRVYRGAAVEVSFDLGLCTHIGACLRGLPGVFELERRPWILPDAADADAVAQTVERCPSGALQYRRLDGRSDEISLETPRVTPIRNGPLLVLGRIEVRGDDGSVQLLPRASLCRCGASKNKPFCDNSHLQIRFEAPGELIRIRLSPVRPAEDQPMSTSDDPRAT